jgi:concanavalin A-like lectin/glucanase superfamily protein
MRALAALPLLLAAALVAAGSPAAAASTCDRSATPATFASELSAASAGQTICLASGNYGTFSGTGKAVTIAAADGASPQMKVNFGAGDSGFTLDGMTGMGGAISSGAHDLTIRNSAFTSTIDVQGSPGPNLLLDHNSHDWNAVYGNGGPNAKIFIWSNSDGASSGLTVQSSTIRNGNLDGIHIGGSAGATILNNTFDNLCDTGTNHTDNLQTEGMVGGRIAGNYMHAAPGCATQGLTSFDSGTVGVVIEDNVIDIHRPWGIEWYSDRDSIIRHNTVRWYADANCDFNGIQCGQIDIDRKSQDPAGSGAQVYDNLATDAGFTNGSTGSAHDNVNGQRAKFAGPSDQYAGFKLAADSPVGVHAASDGMDSGARVGLVTGVPVVSPTPSPTPAPAPAPAPASGLVASYDFDEGSGATVTDGSGHGNEGKISGARRTSAGKRGGALVFDGVNDHVSVPDSDSLDLTRNMTLEAWVRPRASGRRWRSAIFKQRSKGLSYALYANDAHGRASGRVRTGKALGTGGGAGLRRDRWSHVAATYEGHVLRVYLNGRLQSSRSVRGEIATGRGPLELGGDAVWGEWFKGSMDDVRVWRTALSARTIRATASVR